jgi:hypothetical protein
MSNDDIPVQYNQFYTHVANSYAAATQHALVNLNIITQNYQLLKGIATLTGAAIAANVPVLDYRTGIQLHIGGNLQILYYSAIATTAITSGGSPTYDIGFSLNAGTGSPVVTTLQSSAALTPAALNTGVNPLPAVALVSLTGNTNLFLTITSAVASTTTGVVAIFLQVA